MKRAPIFLALLLSAAVTVGAQDKKAKKYAEDGVWWSNWEDGAAEAKARNVPIHFTVHKDN